MTWRAAALAFALSTAASAQTGAVVGRVVSASSGDGLPGATVQLRETGRGAAADADGRFEIRDVAAGEYVAVVRSVGYRTAEESVTVRSGETVRLDVALQEEATVGAAVVVEARRSTTATRADAPVLLVPQAVTVLSESVLDAQNVQSTADALRNVPGATSRARGEPVSVPVLRGFETDQTGGGVRRNGVETPYLFDGLAANVDRVEVLRGPASVLYGRLEPGGVVNFITKVPRAERHAEVVGEGGTLGSARFAVDVGAPVRQQLAVRLNAAADREGSARDHVHTSTALVAPAVRWRLSERLTIDAEAEAVVADATMDPGLPVPSAQVSAVGPIADATPLGPFHGEPDARYRWRSAGVFLSNDLQLGPTASLRTTASLARYALTRDALGLDSLVRRPGGPFVARSIRQEDLRFTYLKGGTFLNARVQTGPAMHALTVGVEAILPWAQVGGTAPLVEEGGGFSFAAIAPIPLTDPQSAGVPGEGDRVRYLEASVRGVDAGLFVQDRMTVPAGPAQLHLVGSARLSYVSARADIVALASTPEAPAGVSDRTMAVTALTPAGGLVAEFRSGLALYVSGGTSFNPIVERVDRNGEPFRPTRGVQVEGGAKLDGLDGRVGAAVAAFWIRKDDALTGGPDGFFDQTGRQRSRGVEVDARGEPVPELTLLTTYAFLDAQVVEDDNVASGTPLPYAPRHSGSVWAEWRPVERLALRGGVWAEGPRRGALGVDLRLPTQVTVDLGAEAVLVSGVRLRVDARNVLGGRGYLAATSRRGLDGDRLLVVWPTPAREVRVGLVVRP